MGGLFGGAAAPAPIIPKIPPRAAPTPLSETGAKVVMGTDALAALNERSGINPTKKEPTATTNTTGLGCLSGFSSLNNFI